jgi:hypothetical protein
MKRKKQHETLRERIETSLRKVCGRVSPERRAAVIVVMLVVFAALNFWVTGRAIWSIGRGDSPVERISLPDVTSPSDAGDPVTDSLQLEFEKMFQEYSNDQDNDTTISEQE